MSRTRAGLIVLCLLFAIALQDVPGDNIVYLEMNSGAFCFRGSVHDMHRGI